MEGRHFQRIPVLVNLGAVAAHIGELIAVTYKEIQDKLSIYVLVSNRKKKLAGTLL